MSDLKGGQLVVIRFGTEAEQLATVMTVFNSGSTSYSFPHCRVQVVNGQALVVANDHLTVATPLDLYSYVTRDLTRQRKFVTLTYLEVAVEEEARRIMELKRQRPSEAAFRAARMAAQEFYGQEICEEMAEPTKLTADQVMSLARRVTIWAVAQKILEE